MNHRKTATLSALALACTCCWLDASAADKSKMRGVDAQFKAMDANGDGRITPQEHAAAAKKMYDAMDKNMDGKVTAEEMDAAHPPAEGEMTAVDKIRVIDANRDGVLTAEEHAAGSRQMFERMDRNEDRFLTRSEFEDGHARLLAKA